MLSRKNMAFESDRSRMQLRVYSLLSRQISNLSALLLQISHGGMTLSLQGRLF